MYICCAWLTRVNWFTCIRIIVVFKNIENSAHISIFYGKSLGELKFGLFFFSQHCHTGVILSAMFSYANAGHLLQNWSFWCHSEMDGSTKYDEIQFTVRNILNFFLLELRCKQSSIAKHAQNAQKHIYCAVIDTNSDI